MLSHATSQLRCHPLGFPMEWLLLEKCMAKPIRMPTQLQSRSSVTAASGINIQRPGSVSVSCWDGRTVGVVRKVAICCDLYCPDPTIVDSDPAVPIGPIWTPIQPPRSNQHPPATKDPNRFNPISWLLNHMAAFHVRCCLAA